VSPRGSNQRTDLLGGRYRLERELAIGGMGAVWEAEDGVLGRRVAVKILSPSLGGDERFVERFRREARAAGGLSHPNIAHVFDYGEDADTRFIVMELLSGETLADRLRRQGRLGPAEAAAIGGQVADALDEAHRAGIVHRDVKPANIMLTPDGGVKVMDFGIAAAGRSSSLTATGSMIGTATYMSPEHAAGGPVTPASDVYSLAVVLYEMLTGDQPFQRDTPIATAMAHVNVDPRPIRDVAADVPAPLAAAIEQGMAKDPAARPRSAAVFAEMLRGVPTLPGEIAPEPASIQPAADPTIVLPVPAATRPLTRELRRGGSHRSGPSRPWRGPALAVAFGLILGLVIWALIALASDPGSNAPPSVSPGSPQRTTRTSPSPTATTVLVPPSLVGMTERDAKHALRDAGLTARVVKVDIRHGESDGKVLRTDPTFGTAVAPGTAVTLYVGHSSKPGHGGDKHKPKHGPGGGD
jgi:serine/threonine protein kinase